MVAALAVKASFEHTQAAGAAELGIEHADQLVPTAKSFAEFVCLMAGDHAREGGAGEKLQELLETVYPKFVAE
jgi:hypothetical protein